MSIARLFPVLCFLLGASRAQNYLPQSGSGEMIPTSTVPTPSPTQVLCGEYEFRCPDEPFSPCYPLSFICDSIRDCFNGYDEEGCNKSSISTTIMPTSTPVVECPDGDVRLVGGNDISGRVEICFNSTWGTVCDDEWDTEDSRVVCRQLGLPTEFPTIINSIIILEVSVPIYLDEVSCNGNEQELYQCSHAGVENHDCSHSEDVHVYCPPVDECENGAVRLVNGGDNTSGRIEICFNNIWGTVCDDLWDTDDARVVCRQLGLPTEFPVAIGSAGFGQGLGLIFLDSVQCNGNEQQLYQCSHDGVGNHDCGSHEDAGVFCSSEMTPTSTVPTPSPTQVPCGEYEFRCPDEPFSPCYPLSFICDSIRDCFNGYDEEGCNKSSISTTIMPTSTPVVECPDGDVRLVDGSDISGRVEICFNGVWGTVCDDLWDTEDSRVVCRQLGLPTEFPTIINSIIIVEVSVPIHLDEVSCNGNEQELHQCSHAGVGNHDCSHFEDVNVYCPPVDECEYGAVRLVNGSDISGRVEICFNGVWGTVCDDFWDTDDARVVCRQLGLPTEFPVAIGSAGFGQGLGLIFLDSVHCNGNEQQLYQCSHDGVGNHDCGSHEDAGVICSSEMTPTSIVPTPSPTQVLCGEYEFRCPDEPFSPCYPLSFICDSFRDCFNGYDEENCSSISTTIMPTSTPVAGCVLDGDVRLVNGNEISGRVEICFNGVWGTVCDDFWGTEDARVVCRQLGLSTELPIITTAPHLFGEGSGPIHLDNLLCDGDEQQLQLCQHDGVGNHNCEHTEDAGVICLSRTTPSIVPTVSPTQVVECPDGDVRLVNGSDISGRVEICFNGVWGTVCDDVWDTEDARVVCRQLGLPTGFPVAVRFAMFGEGSGPIHLDDLLCNGDEQQLHQCSHSGVGNHNCRHTEDAGVICFSRTTPSTVPTVSPTTSTVFPTQVPCGEYEFRCPDEPFSPCYPLSFICDSIRDCFNGYDEENCSSISPTPVPTSTPVAECEYGDVRLVDGSDISGRVEICFNGVWGTVCDDEWDIDDARVVCRQLGLPTLNPIAVSSASFGEGSGPIHLDDVFCVGIEQQLQECSHDGVGNQNCGHYEDAGVICSYVCLDGDVRLVGGDNTSGRVEICFNDVWGTVCDDEWDNEDARVVCRQLGLPTEFSIATRSARFGEGSGPIYLDNVFCVGYEQELHQCSHDGVGYNNCGHYEDAGVICSDAIITPTPSPVVECLDEDVRLVNGSDISGRVEICFNGVWGTVCDDFWDNEDARVVCRQLGLSTGSPTALSSAVFGEGSGRILLDDVECYGNEYLLQQCSHAGLGNHNCVHREDAGVICSSECYFNNRTYSEGATFPTGDNCNNCTCIAGIASCTEIYCPEPCRDDEFQCPDDIYGYCYSLSYICDHYEDCDNGYDEQNCSTIEFTSPLSVDEGTVGTLQFCLTVTEVLEDFIYRHYYLNSGDKSLDEEYLFYNDTIIFNGSYSVGDSECVSVYVNVYDDNLVEGTEEVSYVDNDNDDGFHFPGINVQTFIIDNDYLSIGFQETSYSVSESDGLLEIIVGPVADENGNVPDVAIPLGVRVTSKDGTAVAGADYQRLLTTSYFRPGQEPIVVIQINIIDDSLQEGDERFTVEIQTFDISIILVNAITEIIIEDDEDEGEDDECTVELDGPIEVNGNSATYSFHGVGSGIERFICKLDGVVFDCSESGTTMTDLTPGTHRLRLVPVGCTVNLGNTFRFDV